MFFLVGLYPHPSRLFVIGPSLGDVVTYYRAVKTHRMLQVAGHFSQNSH